MSHLLLYSVHPFSCYVTGLLLAIELMPRRSWATNGNYQKLNVPCVAWFLLLVSGAEKILFWCLVAFHYRSDGRKWHWKHNISNFRFPSVAHKHLCLSSLLRFEEPGYVASKIIQSQVEPTELQQIVNTNTNTTLTQLPHWLSLCLGLAFARVRVNLPRVKIRIQPVTGFNLQQLHRESVRWSN